MDQLVVWHDEVFTLARVLGYRQAELQQAIFSATPLEPGDLLGFQIPRPHRGWEATLAALIEHPEHPPLYYLLVRLGTLPPLHLDPLVAGRGVSAVSGILLIPAVYWLMRSLFAPGPGTWVAAVLIACSPLQLLYAQEAREYALWILTVVASSAALVRALGPEPPRGWRHRWWPYGLLVTLGLYTHLLFALMLPVHGAYVVLARRANAPAAALRGWALAVGAALCAFGPWLWVVLTRHEEAIRHTAWMARPIPIERILGEWANHLTRLFVDVEPGGAGGWGLILMPLAWALIQFVRRGPRPGAWLLLGIALGYAGLVLGADLLLGGSRSQHVRYALPAVLAVQLMVAWVIGARLGAPCTPSRVSAAAALTLIAALGVLSILTIQRADAWWTKGFSAANWELARRLNGGRRPLVLASDSGVSAGELISLAHRLDPRVRIWRERGDAPPPDGGFSPVLALMPSPSLRARLGANRRLDPAAGTWQWFWVRPAAGTGDRLRAAAMPPRAPDGSPRTRGEDPP